MAFFAIKRLLVLAGTMIGVAVLTFLITNIAPGDPARLAAGPNATEAMVATVRSENGLDKPLPEQLWIYLGQMARGDLGKSIVTTQPVTVELRRQLPATLELVAVSMGMGILFGVSLGVLAAVRRDGWVDQVSRIFSVSGVAVPAFWLGLLMQLYFAVRLQWLPVSGRFPLMMEPPPQVTGFYLIDSLLAGQIDKFGVALSYIIMPALVLSLPCLASILRVTRSEMIEVLQSDYIVAARAHGLPQRRIIAYYALKNAMLPVLAMIGLRFGWMLGSTVLVETVFDWPGVGFYAVSSALSSDFKPVIGVTLVITFFFVLANMVVDLAYAWIDPRLRSVA